MRIKIEFNTNGEPIVEVETDECIVPMVIVTKPNGEQTRVDFIGELGTFEHVRFEPTELTDEVDDGPVDISKKWPSWLKAAAVCKDMCGRWFGYQLKPIRGDTVWRGGQCAEINAALHDVILPIEWDWTVPIINPNLKE